MHTTAFPRACLGFTNIFFFLLGSIVCGACVWCAMNPVFFKDVNFTITKSPLVENIVEFVNLKLWFTPLTSILIPIALFTMLTSCCGIFGAGCRTKCAVKSYICLVTIATVFVFWLTFVTGVYNIYTKNQTTARFAVNLIKANYGKEKDLFTATLNYVMRNYGCCGVFNYEDFENSPWKQSNPTFPYPLQCCVFLNMTHMAYDECPIGKFSNIYTNKNIGCLYSLNKSINNSKGKIFMYIIIIGVLYMLLTLFAYCIVRGEPLLVSTMKDKVPLSAKISDTRQNMQSFSLFENNKMCDEEKPQKVVKVVSRCNPHTSYKVEYAPYTPSSHAYQQYHSNY